MCNDEKKMRARKTDKDERKLKKKATATVRKWKRRVMRCKITFSGISISHARDAEITHHLRSTNSRRCRRRGSSSCSSSSPASAPSCTAGNSRSPSGTTQAASDSPSGIPDSPGAAASATSASDGRCCCSSRTGTTCTTRLVDGRCGAGRKLELNVL